MTKIVKATAEDLLLWKQGTAQHYAVLMQYYNEPQHPTAINARNNIDCFRATNKFVHKKSGLYKIIS